MKLETVLVPVDGSWMADRALAFATTLARAASARVDVLAIAPDAVRPVITGPGHEPSVSEARTATPYDVQPRSPADAADAVLVAVSARRPDLVVMAADSWASPGRGDTIAHTVARETTVPVVVVPTGAPSLDVRQGDHRVLVALDGSALAEQALGPASAVADALGAELLVLRVVTPRAAALSTATPDGEAGLASARRYVERLARELSTPRRRVTALAVAGSAPAMIAAVSRAHGASMIAMTTRGRGGSGSSHLGGVAGRSLQSAGMPLLLVPATLTAALGEPPSSALTT